MTFSVKRYDKSDFYETFSKWLLNHKFPLINDLVLPENVFVCSVDEVPCYCIWIYFTDSKLAWIAFPASNPNVSYKKRVNGLSYLINYVCDYAKKKKILSIITTSGTESVIESLIKNQFEIGDRNINHYTRKL